MSRSVLPPLQGVQDKAPSSLGALPPLVSSSTNPSLGVRLMKPGKEQLSRLQQPRQHTLPTPAISSSVKFPALIKPQREASSAPRCNQEEEQVGYSTRSSHEKHAEDDEDNRHRLSSSRTSGSSRSSLLPARAARDKNRDFIKELEDRKRKEKEAAAREERRKKKLHEKRTHKLLQKAREKQEATSPAVQDLPSELPARESGDSSASTAKTEPQEDELGSNDSENEVLEAQRRRDKARREKRLLKKQRAHLEQLQTKQREKQEELELEKERERRKQEKVTKAILTAIQDANSRWEEQETSTKESQGEEDVQSGDKSTALPLLELQEQLQQCASVEDAVEPSEEQEELKQRAKEQREAIRRKQQEYLHKLADQRKQKQKEEEDARILQEKKKRKIQKEAMLRLQEAAARQQATAKAREKEEAQAATDKTATATPPVDVEAMIARLSKLKERDVQVIPEARDFASWKKRHGVGAEQKVFSMTGWYPVIREELEKRGWFFNPDKSSPFFDLKWSLKSDDLKTVKLEKFQYVNHFFQNTAITTKVGLLHNLRNVVWHQSVDIDALFPRAYDLNEPRDMESFIQDFRYSFAEGLLKQLARHGLQRQSHSIEVPAMVANEALVDVVLDVARKKVKSRRPDMDEVASSSVLESTDALEESVDNPLSTGVDDLVTELQWEVLSTCQLDKPGALRASLVYTKKTYADEKPDGAVGDNGGAFQVDTVLSALEKRQQRRAERAMADTFNREKTRLNELLTRVSPVSEKTLDEAIRLARELERRCPQFHINGGAEFLLPEPHVAADTSTSLNVWIVKPAGMSRGRGIRVFNKLEELLEYADVENHKECQWVAQKYIENPLLVCRRKFDIRQWVLVTAWDPLTVWFYEDCYLRFSSEEYSTQDLSDQYVHLTNNSIQKYSDKFHDVYSTDDGEMHVEGNMWHSDDFKKYLASKLGRPDHWDTHVQPRLKEIVVQSLQCVQDLVQHRKNCCELYGYDFMMDETLQPWLIEVNSSPACDYSTPTAKRYVETGLAGVVKVIVDHREYEQKKRSATGACSLEEPDTGCWERIHKAEYIGQPTSSFGADFQVKGSKMQRRRGTKPRVARPVAKAASAAVEKGGLELVQDGEEEEEKVAEERDRDSSDEDANEEADGEVGGDDEDALEAVPGEDESDRSCSSPELEIDPLL